MNGPPVSADPALLPLAIVGMTASGKSAVAMELAARDEAEIVSCDSVLVYQGFEIGCAKPTAVDRARVPHHLLDVVPWHIPFDAKAYADRALAAIVSIQQRGRRPIICGGTGLYLRALRHGLIDLPAADLEKRRAWELEEEAAPGTLFRRLQACDPESAATIDPRNLVRVMRALEITEATGEPASALRRAHGFQRTQVPMQVVQIVRGDAEMQARITRRTKAMLEAGWLHEVETLLGDGVSSQARPMMSVGYREVCAVARGEAPRAELEARVARSTWRYARRQRTWWRRSPDIVSISAAERSTPALAELARDTLRGGRRSCKE